MSPDRGDERLTPAEAAVVELLEPLRSDPPRSHATTTQAVMSTARWQYTVRGTLVLVGDLVGALAEGAALVFGSPPSRPGRR